MNSAENSHLRLVWDNSKDDAFVPDPHSPRLPFAGAFSEEGQPLSKQWEEMSEEELRLFGVFPEDFDKAVPDNRGQADRAYRVLSRLLVEPQKINMMGKAVLDLEVLEGLVTPRKADDPSSAPLFEVVGINARSTIMDITRKVVGYKKSQIEAATHLTDGAA